MELTIHQTIMPDSVREVLSRHILADGMNLVLDMERSQGAKLLDEVSGREFLDFFGFFASSALGMNHHALLSDEAFKKRLMEAALNKVTNSDVYTVHMARFVDTFSRIGIPKYLPYAFFISGGGLAVENAMKAAFDWKVRKNFRKGYRREVGHKVLHLDEAFHGRTGYTLSVTNTADLRKTQYFPKFDWPRISNPKIHFPLTAENLPEQREREQMALAQAKHAFHEHADDIACVLLEPIQGEGGDNHFRPEFLQALKHLAHQNDALLIFDEVQAGVGITGAFWAHQALGVEPDIMAFGKKTQVCGILAGKKLDEVDGHVFQTSSRINSTWGGNLVDMVRFDKILEIIDEEDLVANAKEVGYHLLERIEELEADHDVVTQARGRGLMCAFDLPDSDFRDRVRRKAFDSGLLMLGCGPRSLRFRPPLTVTKEEVDRGVGMLSDAIREASE